MPRAVGRWYSVCAASRVCASHILGVDVAGGEVPASQQHRKFLRVNAISLGFAAVDSFQIESVAEQESQVLIVAEIGEPVPIESGFAADDQVVELLSEVVFLSR